jgi:hypothetical protein
VEKVHFKLRSNGIFSVRSTVSNIILINRKFHSAGLTQLHALTIEVMAREGVNSLRHES